MQDLKDDQHRSQPHRVLDLSNVDVMPRRLEGGNAQETLQLGAARYAREGMRPEDFKSQITAGRHSLRKPQRTNL